MSKEVKFSYIGSPDGEDILKKLLFALKPAAYVSFAAGTIDVALYSHPKTYLPALGRYIYFTWPIIGATTAFVLVQNLSGSIRKKDDKFNWFLGGVAAGNVIGIWRKSIFAGFIMSTAIGVGAVIKKHAIQSGYTFFPEHKQQYGGIRSVRQDWTLFKDRPGNWTTGKTD